MPPDLMYFLLLIAVAGSLGPPSRFVLFIFLRQNFFPLGVITQVFPSLMHFLLFEALASSQKTKKEGEKEREKTFSYSFLWLGVLFLKRNNRTVFPISCLDPSFDVRPKSVDFCSKIFKTEFFINLMKSVSNKASFGKRWVFSSIEIWVIPIHGIRFQKDHDYEKLLRKK